MKAWRDAVVTYWPHVGIAIGVTLNVLGLVTHEERLIVTASNLLVVCGLLLGQRKRGSGRRS